MQNILPVDENAIILCPEKSYCAVKAFPFLLAALIIMFTSWYFTIPLIGILALLALTIGIYKFYLVRTIKYYLTDEQLIITRGILSKRTDYLELYRVIDLFILQPLWLRLFGLMAVKLVTFDYNEKLIILEGIKQSPIALTIRDNVQASRRKNKILTLDKSNTGY